MYRILKSNKDNYITNKVISKHYSVDSNVGQAGTLDLYSLFDESIVYDATGSIVSSGVRESTRALIEFDYSKIQELHDSYQLDLTGGNYTCSLRLMDVYGGQSTPSNFVLEVLPLAKQWSEGRGFDVVAYQHVDASNWITASLSGSTAVTWSLPGASATGSVGASNIDVYVSGNLGLGNQYIGSLAYFARGDEELNANVTHLVSASLANLIANNGFRVAFTKEEEEENKTYFVKRFGARHVQNKDLQPRIDVTTTDDIIRSDKGRAKFKPQTQNFFLFNSGDLSYTNFVNGGFEVTGSNCITLTLQASKQVMVNVTTYSLAHGMTISYMSQSVAIFTTSFTGSQHKIGSRFIPGVYKTDVIVDPYQNTDLAAYLSGSYSDPIKFVGSWKNAANGQLLHTEDILFDGYAGMADISIDKNYVVNIYNLQSVYNATTDGCQRFRVFAQNYNTEQIAYKTPYKTQSDIIPGMKFRVMKAFQNIEYIPFCDATELSYDENGMYFDLYINDFEPGSVYQIDLLLPTGNGSKNDLYLQDQGWRFKVID